MNLLRKFELCKHNKPIKCGTAKAWLGFASLHSLAKHYHPLIGALHGIYMKLRSWKFAFIVSVLLIIVSNAFWTLIVLDLAVTNKYQSMDNYSKKDAIADLGNLIVNGSKDYSKKDIIHLLRQSNSEAFIVDEGDVVIYQNIAFTFKNDKLIQVK